MHAPLRSTSRRPRGYRGPSRPRLRWAPLPLLVAGLTHAHTALGQAPRAARALIRGETLAAADVLAPVGDTLAPRLVGWITRRPIAAGELLRAPAVAPPAVVHAGDPVAVLWQQGGVALRLAGTATTDAALGTRVAVRVDVRRRFEGTVTAPGVVTIQ